MTELTFTLLVIGMPGIICYFLTKKLIGRGQRTPIETVFLVFLYSVLSYSLLAFAEGAMSTFVGRGFKSDAIGIFLRKEPDIRVGTLLKGVGAGVALAYLLSYCVHFNLVNLIGQKAKATKRYGDEDVWRYFHNARDREKNYGWVMVRDLRANLVYHCYISTWSDSGTDRELILSDVSVFTNDTAEYLYDAKHIYLARRRDDLMIEVPPENASELAEYRVDVAGREGRDA